MAKSGYKCVIGDCHYLEIKSIIDNAQKYLILCAPYWWAQNDEDRLSKDFSSDILLPIVRCVNKGVKVVLISSAKYYESLKTMFREEFGVSVYVCYSDNFHCKVYMNEKSILVTSMNLCNNTKNDIGCLFENDMNLRKEIFEVIENEILEHNYHKQYFKKVAYS